MSTRNKWAAFCIGIVLLVALVFIVLVFLVIPEQPKNNVSGEQALLTSNTADSSYFSDDFDNDGLLDLCHFDRVSRRWTVFLATESKFDFDGDGVCDAYHFDSQTGHWAVAFAVPHEGALIDTALERQWLQSAPPSIEHSWGI